MISSVSLTPAIDPMAAAAGSSLLIKRGSLSLKPLAIADPSPAPSFDSSQVDAAPALSLRDTGHISSVTLPHMPLDADTTPAPLARCEMPRPTSAAGANACANPQPAPTSQVATRQPASVLRSSSSLQIQPHASAPAALTSAVPTTAPTSPTPQHSTHQLAPALDTNATRQAPVLASQLAQKLAASLGGGGSSSQDSPSLPRSSTDTESGSSADAGAAPPLKRGPFDAVETLRRAQTHGACSKPVLAADIHFMSPPPLDIHVYHASSKQDERTSADLQPLEDGCQLYMRGGDSPLDPSTVKSVPERLFPKGCLFLRSEMQDSTVRATDLLISGSMQAGSAVFCRLYVLLPLYMRPPAWLRNGFTVEKRSSMHVAVEWDVQWVHRRLLQVARKGQAYEKQELQVWESNDILKPGQGFSLNGIGGTGELTDHNYVLAFRFSHNEEDLRKVVLSGDEESELEARTVHNKDAVELNRICANVQEGVVESKTVQVVDANPWCAWLPKHARDAGSQEHHTMPDGRTYIEQLWLAAVEDAVTNCEDYELLRRLVDRDGLLDEFSQNSKILRAMEAQAFKHEDVKMVLWLCQGERSDMSWKSLRFLLHQSAVRRSRFGPSLGGPKSAEEEEDTEVHVEKFLVEYIITRRNPLSVVAAILQAIHAEISSVDETRRVMRSLLAKFHSLQTALIKRLNRHTDSGIALMEQILDPASTVSNSINDTNPLMVALESGDVEFVNQRLCVAYTTSRWNGSDFALLTSRDHPHALSLLSPLVGWRMLRNLGLSGGVGDGFLKFTMRLWHLYVLASQAFFMSPRGRWALHALCEVVFLIIFQLIIMSPDSRRFQRPLCAAFELFVLGNLLDVGHFVRLKYGSLGMLQRYAQDPWNSLNLFVNSALVVLLAARLWYGSDSQVAFDEGAPGVGGVSPLQMAIAGMAPFVWVRSLSMVVPIYPSLGPLLATVANMFSELIAFAFPLVVVMIGFASTLTAVYRDSIAEYATTTRAMRQLFVSMLGGSDFTVFEAAPTPFALNKVLFGDIVLILYLLITTVLLLNLLIAVLTHRYRPEEVEAETQFKQAVIVSYYHTQVQHNLLPSPFSIPQLLTNLLPSGHRNKKSGRLTRALGLPPLDGYLFASSPAAEAAAAIVKFGSKAQRAAVASAAAAAVAESAPEARGPRDSFSRDSDTDLMSGPRAGRLASGHQPSRLKSVMVPQAGDVISNGQVDDVAHFMSQMGAAAAAKAVHFGSDGGLERVSDAEDPSGSEKEGDGFQRRGMRSQASAGSAGGAATLHLPSPFGIAGQRARENCLDRMNLVPTGAGELPHLMYLLTLYPVMAVIVNVCYYVYTPLAVMHFAIKGYTRFHNIAENKHSTAAVGDGDDIARDVPGSFRPRPLHRHHPGHRNSWARLCLWLWAAMRTILVTILGTLLYVLVSGVLVLTLYSTLYVWLGKLVFSLWNLVRVQRRDVLLARNQRRIQNQDPRSELGSGLDGGSHRDAHTSAGQQGQVHGPRSDPAVVQMGGNKGRVLVYLTPAEVLAAVRHSAFASRVEEWGLESCVTGGSMGGLRAPPSQSTCHWWQCRPGGGGGTQDASFGPRAAAAAAAAVAQEEEGGSDDEDVGAAEERYKASVSSTLEALLTEVRRLGQLVRAEL
ncbi:MAG: hypothetical protein WDW36_004469 [Sanguina aurantia]